MDTASPSSVARRPDGRRLRMFTWGDALIVLLVAAASALTLPAFRNFAPDKVSIFRDDKLIAAYPLGEDRGITVEGAIGPVEIAIRNRRVSIVRSTCPHGICMKTGPVDRPHGQIVCAPNHILVVITSSAGDSLDAIVR